MSRIKETVLSVIADKIASRMVEDLSLATRSECYAVAIDLITKAGYKLIGGSSVIQNRYESGDPVKLEQLLAAKGYKMESFDVLHRWSVEGEMELPNRQKARMYTQIDIFDDRVVLLDCGIQQIYGTY